MGINFSKRDRGFDILNFKAFVIIAIIFAVIYLITNLIPDNSQELFFDKIRKREIKTIVTKKFTDYSNHGATYVIYGKDSLPTQDDMDENIHVGDSIIKPLNSLEMTIKNKNFNMTYDYQAYELMLTNNF